MASAESKELVDKFEQFYRRYYNDAIATLAQRYPDEQKSLHIDWLDLFQYDPDLANDFTSQPHQLRDHAEEALRLYDLPIDTNLGQAHVRIQHLDDHTQIRNIRSRHINTLVSIQGMVRKATDVRPKITEAAFECQRCGTLNRIPQSSGFQEPHECQGCERQGPFEINTDQSEFIDAQKLRIQESPEGLRGGETPQGIDVHVEDDLAGTVTPGDHVTVTGVLHLDQQERGGEKTAMYDIYMDGWSIALEDEEFENMEITDEDKAAIVDLSETDDIYDQITASIAPSIYGFDQEKLAMALQLFSGVTKHLPDGSRTRGDLHILLIGDPGTGKCLAGDTKVTLADGTETPIRDLVESNLDDPKPVDDGVYDDIDITVPSLQSDGTIETQHATRVWKREAPDAMYHIRTATGRELEVTPSHPLFRSIGTDFEPVPAEDLSVGDRIVTSCHRPSGQTRTDGGARIASASTGRPETEFSVNREKIVAIERVDSDFSWVYDLEVEGTHNYLSNGVVSHNSALLQYIGNIAPRSVYTSGKGSSAAGLCVTGDTLIHTADGFSAIEDLATSAHPDPVETESAASAEIDVYSFDRESGNTQIETSSHVWRMPEKECRRIETAHGKELEASVSTPVLTCGETGFEWTPIADVESGDYVAVPRYQQIERTSPPLRDYVEYTNEKVILDEDSLEFLRTELEATYDTLAAAARDLGLSSDFIYSHLWNRHVPLEKLDRILSAIDATREDIHIERAMLRHGDSIRIPEKFDEDLMYLIGLVFGDGDLMVSRRGENRGQIRISNGDESILRRAIDIADEKFDKQVEIEYQKNRVPSIRVHSATIARFFANLGMTTPKHSLALADRLTTAEHVDAFLRGFMDADGSVSRRDAGGSSVLTSTISEEFATQLQLILETYGIRSRTRERDRRGTYELEDGRTIESQSVQYFVEIFGEDIERYSEAIGFDATEKRAALNELVGSTERRQESLPLGTALTTVETTGGQYYMNVNRGNDPGRERAAAMLDDLDLGEVGPIVEEAVNADLRWDEVVATVDTGKKEVYDLTVPKTHNFVGNGVVTHNTAAAVRDDFGDGQQWTLEAGALVLADKGIAAVDELDKMRSEDRSAMHQALESQEISISKAGINATLKSRCSLLGAANPKYGRFDQYEPLGEQIDLEPALISRFDLIFTVSDQPDEEKDKALADHILQTNYAGELNTHQSEVSAADVSDEELAEEVAPVDPAIEPELLRKYIAHAKSSVFPTMSDGARERIREFYVDLRSLGQGEDSPVPVTARQLEALVRLAEASARVRLSDTVTEEDAERVIEIVRSSLEDIGVDPETGQFDADVVEVGTSKSQRDRIKNIRGIIGELEEEYEEGAPVEEVLDRAEEVGTERSKAEHEIEKLKQKGEVYQPSQGHLRTT